MRAALHEAVTRERRAALVEARERIQEEPPAGHRACTVHFVFLDGSETTYRFKYTSTVAHLYEYADVYMNDTLGTDMPFFEFFDDGSPTPLLKSEERLLSIGSPAKLRLVVQQALPPGEDEESTAAVVASPGKKKKGSRR